MTKENRKHLNTIQSLLTQIDLITDRYEEIERITGEKFNVFTILAKSTDEIAHSKFIANLLNPKGTHGQGDLYLRLFIDHMREKFIDSKNKEKDELEMIHPFILYTLNFLEGLSSIENSLNTPNHYAPRVNYSTHLGVISIWA